MAPLFGKAGATKEEDVVGGGLLKAAGIGLEVAGALQEGATAESIGKYNQQVSSMQAKEIEAKTAFDQMRQAEEGSRVISSMEAAQARAEGAMAKWQGRQAKRQSYLKAGGTLLSGF